MFGCSADVSPLGAGARQMGRGLSFALALAVFVLSGKSAIASCGDYVVIGKPAEHQAAQQAKPSHPEAPKPCHGPNCQASPRPFAAPPAASTTLIRAPESCIVLGGAATDLIVASLARRSEVPLAQPLYGCYPPQWRPPEAAASRLL